MWLCTSAPHRVEAVLGHWNILGTLYMLLDFKYSVQSRTRHRVIQSGVSAESEDSIPILCRLLVLESESEERIITIAVTIIYNVVFGIALLPLVVLVMVELELIQISLRFRLQIVNIINEAAMMIKKVPVDDNLD